MVVEKIGLREVWGVLRVEVKLRCCDNSLNKKFRCVIKDVFKMRFGYWRCIFKIISRFSGGLCYWEVSEKDFWVIMYGGNIYRGGKDG